MAKVTNNFLKGKMNKDLDERLVPKGEYREAQNILITQSEGSDVGAIENILGNALSRTDVFSHLKIENIETIGYYADVLSKKVFWFVSNFTGDANDVRTMSRASVMDTCMILMIDLDNDASSITTLVSGSFLNFSKDHLITGVNLIDDLLFWTDNYNQPRKINITKAIADQYYYTKEEQISVAKVAPYLAPILYNENAEAEIDNVPLTNDEDVFSDYLNGDTTVYNDMNINAVGTSVIRVASGTTVSAGDLLSSKGDGTAKLQGDDIIKTKTIGKVLSNVKQETYSDGSYTVPCALYCG